MSKNIPKKNDPENSHKGIDILSNMNYYINVSIHIREQKGEQR